MLKNPHKTVTAYFAAILLFAAYLAFPVGADSFPAYLEEKEAAALLIPEDAKECNVMSENGIINGIDKDCGETALVPQDFNGTKNMFVNSSLSVPNSVTKLILPDSIKGILSQQGNRLDVKGTFYENKNINQVIPGKSLKYIGSKAFYGASALEYFFLPYLTTYIGERAFAYCNSLTSFKVFGNTAIDDGAFTGCSSLSSVFLSERVTRVGLGAFEHTPFFDSLTDEFGISGDILLKYNGNGGKVIIPDGVRVVADGVFAGRLGIEEVVIPDSVRYIGNSAFRSCADLKSITVLSSDTENEDADINLTVGINSFEGCDLDEESIVLLKSLPIDARKQYYTELNCNLIGKMPLNFLMLEDPLKNYKNDEPKNKADVPEHTDTAPVPPGIPTNDGLPAYKSDFETDIEKLNNYRMAQRDPSADGTTA